MTSSPANQVVVYVVEDDDGIRDAICWLLESVRIEAKCYGDANTFLANFQPQHCGCIITDVRMPGMSGIELVEELARRKNHLPILVITGHGDVPMAVRAMKAKAYDFILKPFNEHDLLEKVQNAIAYSKTNASNWQAKHFAERLKELTSREQEVLHHIIDGKINKQIAHELGISLSTVELHRSNMMHKLKVRTIAELVRLYVQAVQTA